METASRNCPLSCPAHRGAETGSVVRPASPLGAPWAGRPVPRSCDVPVAPCGCQAPSEKAPPGQLSTDANQRLAAPGAAATRSAGSAPGSEGRGGGRRLRLGLASETISCSLEGSQRGVWDALEVEESPAARGPWRGGHPVEPGCCPPVCGRPCAPPGGRLGPLACHGRHGGYTRPGQGRTGQGLCVASGRVQSGCFFGVTSQRGLEQPPPGALRLGPAWPPRGRGSVTFQQVRTDLKWLTRVTHAQCSRKNVGGGGAGRVIMRTGSTLPGAPGREPRNPTALEKAALAPQAPCRPAGLCPPHHARPHAHAQHAWHTSSRAHHSTHVHMQHACSHVHAHAAHVHTHTRHMLAWAHTWHMGTHSTHTPTCSTQLTCTQMYTCVNTLAHVCARACTHTRRAWAPPLPGRHLL